MNKLGVRGYVYCIWLVKLKKTQSMAKPHHLILLLLLFTTLQSSSVTASTSNHIYNVGDIVPFFVNKVGPFNNPRSTIPFTSIFIQFSFSYFFPFSFNFSLYHSHLQWNLWILWITILQTRSVTIKSNY